MNERLDIAILAALRRNANTLPGIAIAVGDDGRDILKRLQILAGLGRVVCEKQSGYVMWDLSDKERERDEDTIQPQAPGPASPRAPAAAVAPAPAKANGKKQPNFARKAMTAFVVRPYVRVPELRVLLMNGGVDVLIETFLPEDGEGAGVLVPITDVPALITALQQALAA